MLVLTRKVDQSIQIGDSISVTLLKVKGRSVRIGIEAPAEVRVRRSELPLLVAEKAEELSESSLPDSGRATSRCSEATAKSRMNRAQDDAGPRPNRGRHQRAATCSVAGQGLGSPVVSRRAEDQSRCHHCRGTAAGR